MKHALSSEDKNALRKLFVNRLSRLSMPPDIAREYGDTAFEDLWNDVEETVKGLSHDEAMRIARDKILKEAEVIYERWREATEKTSQRLTKSSLLLPISPFTPSTPPEVVRRRCVNCGRPFLTLDEDWLAVAKMALFHLDDKYFRICDWCAWRKFRFPPLETALEMALSQSHTLPGLREPIRLMIRLLKKAKQQGEQ